MEEISLTRLSSKGQIVIPIEMRKDMKEGDKLIVIRNKDQIILKKASSLDKQFAEDLEFARRTEEAYKEVEEGRYKTYSKEEFLKKLNEW